MKPFTIPLVLSLLPAWANAALVFNVYDEGDDIVIHASGTANLGGLTFDSTNTVFAQLSPGTAAVSVANSSSGDFYGSITGPTSFGSQFGFTDFTPRSGDTFGIVGVVSQLVVPVGYVSGDPLEGMARFPNQSLDFFADLPVGSSFEWTWGSGANADSARVNITTAPVPLPPTIALFGLGALAAGITRRRYRRTASR